MTQPYLYSSFRFSQFSFFLHDINYRNLVNDPLVPYACLCIKWLDFLATKNRNVLRQWLEGGNRHNVVADRWMNIKEGACGIALTSLEDPACGKRTAGG